MDEPVSSRKTHALTEDPLSGHTPMMQHNPFRFAIIAFFCF